MKALLSITVCMVLFFMGCQEQALNTESIDYSRLSVVELSDEVSKDPVFIDLHNQSNSEFSKMAAMIKNEKNSEQAKNFSNEEILDQLGLNEEYWEKREKDIVDKALYLTDKFMLDERPEEEVIRMFKFLYNKTFSQSTLSENDKSDSCLIKFKEDIAEAHANHDFSFSVKCPLKANTTGYSACSSNAAYTAVVAIANAIDEYNASMSSTGS